MQRSFTLNVEHVCLGIGSSCECQNQIAKNKKRWHLNIANINSRATKIIVPKNESTKKNYTKKIITYKIFNAFNYIVLYSIDGS